MSHVFVLRGDITHLECDAWLLPTDARYEITESWEAALPGLRTRASDARVPDFGHRLLAHELPTSDPGAPRIVVTAVPLRGFHKAKELLPALLAYFEAAAASADDRREHIPAARRRERPLLALPLFGTQGGGGDLRRGDVLGVLLDAAREAADRHAADVAIVLRDQPSYALAQRIRRERKDSWSSLSATLLATAEGLSDDARSGRLVPFMGSGVSVSAGGPTWAGLIRALAGDMGIGSAEAESLLDPTRNALDQAAALRALFDSRMSQGGTSPRTFNDSIAEKVTLDRYGLAPALLALLPAEEAITLNYDTVFESAAVDVGLGRRLIPSAGSRFDTAAAPRWLLKLHGTVDDPSTIILTRDDYLGFEADRAALSSLVKATLMTRHLLFVGFGLADDHFHEIVYDVRRAVREQGTAPQRLGTVVKLLPDPLDAALWGDTLDIVPVAPAGTEVAVAGRMLEIFLDALLCHASDSHSYLLTPGFDEGLSRDERDLRDRLLELEHTVSPASKRTAAWSVVESALNRLRRQ